MTGVAKHNLKDTNETLHLHLYTMLSEMRRHSHHFLFILISFVSLCSQYYAGGFRPIVFHDSPYPIDPISLLSKFGSLWRDIANFGYFDPSGPFLSLWYLFLSPIFLLTNDLVITQFSFLFIICNVTLFGSYILAQYLGINKTLSILIAVLYLANPLSIFYTWRILNADIILHAMLPLIFLSVIKIVNGEKTRKYIFILLFTEFLSLPGFANLAYYASFAFVILLLGISFGFVACFSSKISSKKAILRNLLIFGMLILPLSAYLMSTFEIQPRELSALRDTHLQSAETIYLTNTQHINLSSLFSLTSLPPLYEKLIWFDYEYIYLPNISSVFGIAVASVIVVSLTIRIIFSKEGVSRNMYAFIGILAVLTVILLRETGFLILQYSPTLLLAFRDPYHKFETEFTLVLIILFCYSVQELFKLRIVIGHKSLKIAITLIVVSILVYWAWPFYSGNFAPTKVGEPQVNLHPISAFADMPSKYMPAVKYLKQDNEVVTGKSRVLVYPLASILWCDGNGTYWGNDILRFSGISTVSTVHQVNFQNESNFISSLSDNTILSDYNFANYIHKLGIKYVVIKRQACDVDTLSGNIKDLRNQSKEIEEKLSNSQFDHVMDNQYYSIFRLKGGDPSSISILDASSNESLKYNYNNNNNNNSVSSINSANSSKVLSLLHGTGQLVKYQKISSTEYTVNVESDRKPFYLIFAESYDDGWKAFINEKEKVDDKYHFVVGGFANGWYINEAGHFKVRLYFQPQKYHDAGLAIYIVVVCVSTIYLLLNTHRAGIRGIVSRLMKPRKT
jgi:hypothetical protein